MQSIPVVLSPRATETLQSGGLGGGLLPKANSVHPPLPTGSVPLLLCNVRSPDALFTEVY